MDGKALINMPSKAIFFRLGSRTTSEMGLRQPLETHLSMPSLKISGPDEKKLPGSIQIRDSGLFVPQSAGFHSSRRWKMFSVFIV